MNVPLSDLKRPNQELILRPSYTLVKTRESAKMVTWQSILIISLRGLRRIKSASF